MPTTTREAVSSARPCSPIRKHGQAGMLAEVNVHSEGDLARTHGTIHSMTLGEVAGKRLEVGMYYLSVCTGGDALSNLRVRLFIPAPGSPEIEYCWYGVRRRTRSANKVAEEAAHAQWMQTKEAITSKNISRKIAAAGLTRVAGQKVQAHAHILTPSVGLRVFERKTTCVARRHRHQWWVLGGLPQHAHIEFVLDSNGIPPGSTTLLVGQMIATS